MRVPSFSGRIVASKKLCVLLKNVQEVAGLQRAVPLAGSKHQSGSYLPYFYYISHPATALLGCFAFRFPAAICYSIRVRFDLQLLSKPSLFSLAAVSAAHGDKLRIAKGPPPCNCSCEIFCHFLLGRRQAFLLAPPYVRQGIGLASSCAGI
jgi:hypothetical protein